MVIKFNLRSKSGSRNYLASVRPELELMKINMSCNTKMSQKQPSKNNFTILPKVAMLINQCKSKCQDYRILVKGQDEENVQDTKRITIVITPSGNLVKTYNG